VAKQREADSSLQDRQKLYEAVGRRVREARKAAKLTQEDLASRVSLTRTSVTNIEKGRQKLLLHTLFELASAMKTPVNRLIPESEPAERVQIERELNSGLSKAERDWIISEVSKPSKQANKL